MNIGVLRERKPDERRVALRPDQVGTLLDSGHHVFVEVGAGNAAGYTDSQYSSHGANSVSQRELYDKSELLVKVKCPLPNEAELLNDGHVLFTYLHFDENISAENIRRIVDTGVVGIAYEWVREGHSVLPLLQPMSELAGAVFARKAMDLLVTHKSTLGGAYLASWPSSTAMVIGVGNIGRNAINVLARNQFKLVIVDKHPDTLEQRVTQCMPVELFRNALKHVVLFDEANSSCSAEEVRQWLPETDIVICAAVRRPSLPKTQLPYLIRRKDVCTMAPNSVICDATACDRDLIETCVSSELLTHYDIEERVIHYNCDHVPSVVAKTATELLTDATFPYIVNLAHGFRKAMQMSTGLAGAVMCYDRQVTHEYCAMKKGLPFTPLDELL